MDKRCAIIPLLRTPNFFVEKLDAIKVTPDQLVDCAYFMTCCMS